MMITPSARGSFLAGIGFWALVWSFLFHLDTLAGLLHLQRFVNTKRAIRWVEEHKIFTLMCTEAGNYGIHGISNPLAVTFALGGTFTNILFLFVFLPLRRLVLGDRL